jgi:hypothetical protein
MEPQPWEDLEKPVDSLRTVKDLAAGAAGGIAQVLLGMCAVRNIALPLFPSLYMFNSYNSLLILV